MKTHNSEENISTHQISNDFPSLVRETLPLVGRGALTSGRFKDVSALAKRLEAASKDKLGEGDKNFLHASTFRKAAVPSSERFQQDVFEAAIPYMPKGFELLKPDSGDADMFIRDHAVNEAHRRLVKQYGVEHRFETKTVAAKALEPIVKVMELEGYQKLPAYNAVVKGSSTNSDLFTPMVDSNWIAKPRPEKLKEKREESQGGKVKNRQQRENTILLYVIQSMPPSDKPLFKYIFAVLVTKEWPYSRNHTYTICTVIGSDEVRYAYYLYMKASRLRSSKERLG